MSLRREEFSGTLHCPSGVVSYQSKSFPGWDWTREELNVAVCIRGTRGKPKACLWCCKSVPGIQPVLQQERIGFASLCLLEWTPPPLFSTSMGQIWVRGSGIVPSWGVPLLKTYSVKAVFALPLWRSFLTTGKHDSASRAEYVRNSRGNSDFDLGKPHLSEAVC